MKVFVLIVALMEHTLKDKHVLNVLILVHNVLIVRVVSNVVMDIIYLESNVYNNVL